MPDTTDPTAASERSGIRRRQISSVALLLLALGLVACAPVPRGSSALQPEILVAGLPLEISAGERVFVRMPFSYAAFGYAPHDPDLRGFRFLGPSAQPPSNDVRSAFALGEIGIPLGWELALARATAHRTPLNDGNMSNAPDGVEYRLDMVFELFVPGDAAPGRYPVSGVLRSRSAGRADFAFVVIVP